MGNSSDNNSAVKIAVRERPSRDYFQSNLHSSVIGYHPNGNNIIVNESVFTFDHVLGPMVTQKEIFDQLIKPLVVKLKQGFNCTALAYGQTGTGKSYTMGLNSKTFNDDNAGVIPRCLREILAMSKENCGNEDNNENMEISQNTEISVSFIEIYNEKVYDLLGENTNIPIVAKGYKYTGGIRMNLNNLQDCYAILMQGNRNRHVRPTKMNLQSSRSHAIFTIHVRSRKQNVNGQEGVISSCMNIVDLAGSEGVRRTGHQGMAMSEGVHINQGLLSIGKVLQAITTGSKVIPYRDSVLSSVLQESLNSNSYLTLLACVSPYREDLGITLSTLRFAQNAKQLKNSPEINNIIADIKKNIKLKQTPHKPKPMQINNTRVSPLKCLNSTLCGVRLKSSVKSHTFCTPKKRRIEVNKCNQTEISSICNRAKLSTDGINLPKMNQFESTHNRESLFNRSSDSNGSLMSLNISTSTAIDGHSNKRSTNFSPVIRKCMSEFKSNLEDNLSNILRNSLQTLLPQTSAPAASRKMPNVLSSSMRDELKTIVKEVLYERVITNDEEDIFKIPKIPTKVNQIRTSSPLNNKKDFSTLSESFSHTLFSGETNSEETVLNKSIRRSRRIVEKEQQEQSMNANDSVVTIADPSLRRSSRKSVLQMYQNKRQSLRLSARSTSLQITKSETNSKTAKNNKKSSIINNIIIEGYCNGSTSAITNTSLTKHRKAVLELLNKGSMKELQILPHVGQKTAYQIVTQRTLSGKFKNWSQVEKLPIWRGSGFERFAQANMII